MSSPETTGGDSAAARTDASVWLHFAGVAGTGMSALAQFHALQAREGGGLATGSDRAFDRGEHPEIRRCLEALGVRILPQTAEPWAGYRQEHAAGGRPCAAFVTSTAVEETVGDVAAAGRMGIPVLHRSELLARYVAGHRTIAVTGTSGKSTVTAMIFTIMEACGWRPGLLTGGPLVALSRRGLLGNAWYPDPAAGCPPAPAPSSPGHADAPWLVIEADESDGSLVRYHPRAAVILNLGLDHKPPAEILRMFRIFRDQTAGPVVLGAEEPLATLRPGAELFGLADRIPPASAPSGPGAGTWATGVELSPRESRFSIEGVPFVLPQPGLHNVLNATAAVAACRAVGLPVRAMAEPLAAFAGVVRRFQSLGLVRGVEVIDDFAHNPDKIAAALAAARARLGPQGRVLAVFQPHGFGPTRFLREALVEAFAVNLRPRDALWMAEIFFAGGTVVRDIASADLAADIRARGRTATHVADRAAIPAAIAAAAVPGDLVLVMGARDPSLTDLGRAVLEALRPAPPAE